MNNLILKDLCEKFGYSFIEFLHQNFDKDTSVSKIINNKTSQFSILKILGPNSNDDVKIAFLNEIEFYKRNSSLCAPKMLFSGENFLIIEFFPSVSLREFIESNFFQNNFDDNKFNELIENISNVLDQFFKIENQIFVAKENQIQLISNTLFDRIGNLISSGPEFTKSSKFEQFVIRQFFKFSSRKLKSNIEKIVINLISNDVMVMNDIGHYDLHSENVLVGKTCKIIDFGNYKKPGIWISDLLYFYSTIYASFSSNEVYQKQISELAFSYICSIEPALKKINISELVNLFCFAADSNSRFRIANGGLKFFKLLKFVMTVYNFKI